MTTYVRRELTKGGISYRVVLKRDKYEKIPDSWRVEKSNSKTIFGTKVWKEVYNGKFNNEDDAVILMDQIFGNLK